MKANACDSEFASAAIIGLSLHLTLRAASNRTSRGFLPTGLLRTPCGLQHNGFQQVHAGCSHNGRRQTTHGNGLYGQLGSGSHTHGIQLAQYVTRAPHLAHFLPQESNAFPALQDLSPHQTVPCACFVHQGGKAQMESLALRAKLATSLAPTRRAAKLVISDGLAQMERIVSTAPQVQSLKCRVDPVLACSAWLVK